MGITIKSNQDAWFTISSVVNGSAALRGAVSDLETAYQEAQKAIAVAITEHADIGSLDLLVSRSELELLGENRRRLRSFAQGVHYEISERVDNRFSVQMRDTVAKAYALRPEDIQVRTGRAFSRTRTTSLAGLLEAKLTDDDLRSDFQARVDALNNNEKSVELQQSILEAEFWQSEFVMAREIQGITERIFTDRIRANWEDKTPEERIAIMEQLTSEIMAVMFASLPANRRGEVVFKRLNDDGEYEYITGNGLMSPGGGGSGVDLIGLNPNFRDYATGNFSLDQLIRVVVHEVRHSYQWEVRDWIRQDEETRGPNPFPRIPYSVMIDWGRDYIRYNRLDPPLGNFMQYYLQPVEVDANAFAGLARPRENLEGGQ